jgi:hypothetical protein
MEIDRHTLEQLLGRARRAAPETAEEHRVIEDVEDALHRDAMAHATPAPDEYEQLELFDASVYEAR